MRRIHLLTLCAAMICFVALAVGTYFKHIGQGDAPIPEKKMSESARKILQENPFYLRADAKLQISLNIPADHPKLVQIVTQLREATGLNIAVDENLHDHDPSYGYIQPSKQGYHAWQIMEMIAKKHLQDGYWEKTEGGYRLAGSPIAAARTSLRENSTDARSVAGASQRSRQTRVIVATVSLVLLVILAVLRLRTSRGQSLERAEQIEPRP